MAEITNSPASVENATAVQDETETLSAQFIDWARTEFIWYAGSFTVHLLALSLLLLLGPIMSQQGKSDIPEFVSKAPDAEQKPDPIDPVPIGEIENVDPKELTLDPVQPPLGIQIPTDDKTNDNKPANTDGGGTRNGLDGMAGGVGGTMALSPGPRIGGDPTITGTGNGNGPGNGGDKIGIKGRGPRRGVITGGPRAERAVNAALAWLAKHQLPDGSWNLQSYMQCCHDKTCTGQGDVSADAGATAMGLLPFLATGQTHKSKGLYKENLARGIAWLLRNQQPDGNLAKGAHQMMYSHGLATIALCEAYGLSGDRQVGMAAQRAVDFILAAQNRNDGGWRYNPGDAGDTSVVGWQLMALKSAHLAGLSVSGSAFSNTSKWLDSVAMHDGTEYAYQPGQISSPAMTSVGLLCRQYLGAKADDPRLVGGMDYLMQHLPDESFKNVYYWYYATQVMHNYENYEWDQWNRKMRNILIHSQVRDGTCANGSWDPSNDAWGRHGGRVMQTALSTLTLEVYYRYLPLFKSDPAEKAGRGAAAAAKPEKSR